MQDICTPLELPCRAQHTLSLVLVERAIAGVSWHDVISGRSDLNPAAWRAVDPSSARAQISCRTYFNSVHGVKYVAL